MRKRNHWLLEYPYWDSADLQKIDPANGGWMAVGLRSRHKGGGLDSINALSLDQMCSRYLKQVRDRRFAAKPPKAIIHHLRRLPEDHPLYARVMTRIGLHLATSFE